ncbi:probable SH3 domain-containing YSC84-like protein 1 [Coccomyxa sp. Obi]|nr:probable SH3 domain-containing YSC84-like protein 1 [Coccomyxa sp. Obi]
MSSSRRKPFRGYGRTHVLAENIVPRDAFKGAKGVVFLQAAYAAAGVTAFRGQGFIVAAVGGHWSAPLFLTLSSLGVGLSIGGEMVDTIGILYRDEDIDKYKQGDFRITSYRIGCPLATLTASGTADEDPAVYTAVSGKLLDFSINGGQMTHNNAANAKAYGALVTPDDILSGRVDAPADMAALYKQLTKLSRSGVSSA